MPGRRGGSRHILDEHARSATWRRPVGTNLDELCCLTANYAGSHEQLSTFPVTIATAMAAVA